MRTHALDLDWRLHPASLLPLWQHDSALVALLAQPIDSCLTLHIATAAERLLAPHARRLGRRASTPPLAHWLLDVATQSGASSGVLLMALVYLGRVCTAADDVLPPATHRASTSHTCRRGAAAGTNSTRSRTSSAPMHHRMLLAGLIVATKMAHDRPLKNCVWARYSRGLFTLADINHSETHMLRLLQYRLTVQEHDLVDVAAVLLPPSTPGPVIPARVLPVHAAELEDCRSWARHSSQGVPDTTGTDSSTTTAPPTPTPSLGHTRCGTAASGTSASSAALATPACPGTVDSLVPSHGIPRRVSSGKWLARLRAYETVENLHEDGQAVTGGPGGSTTSPPPSSLRLAGPGPSTIMRQRERQWHAVRTMHQYRWSEPPAPRTQGSTAMHATEWPVPDMGPVGSASRPVSFPACEPGGRVSVVSVVPVAGPTVVALSYTPCDHDGSTTLADLEAGNVDGPSPSGPTTSAFVDGLGEGPARHPSLLRRRHLRDLRDRASELRFRTQRKIRSLMRHS